MLSAFCLTTKLTSVDREYARIRYFFISLRLLTFSMRLYLLIFLLFLFGNTVKAQNLDSVNHRLNRIDSLSTAAQDTVSLIQQDSLASAQDTLSIIGVGDIMMGTNYPEDKLPPRDGDFL